jgi:hypothetical protein
MYNTPLTTVGVAWMAAPALNDHLPSPVRASTATNRPSRLPTYTVPLFVVGVGVGVAPGSGAVSEQDNMKPGSNRQHRAERNKGEVFMIRRLISQMNASKVMHRKMVGNPIFMGRGNYVVTT